MHDSNTHYPSLFPVAFGAWSPWTEVLGQGDGLKLMLRMVCKELQLSRRSAKRY